jgi:hypothetical protein
MHPIQVDVVGSRSLQAGFYRLHHPLALIARRIRIVTGLVEGVFGGQNDALAMILNELTQEFFAPTAGVEIRRVNKVSACLAIGLIDFLRFSLR